MYFICDFKQKTEIKYSLAGNLKKTDLWFSL